MGLAGDAPLRMKAWRVHLASSSACRLMGGETVKAGLRFPYSDGAGIIYGTRIVMTVYSPNWLSMEIP